MKLLKYINILFAVLLAFQSCKEDEKLMYEEDPRVYIYKYGASNGTDSVNYSFAFAEQAVRTDTVTIPFRIMGFPSNVDRRITMKQEEGTTAKEGYHYKWESLLIPANSSDGEAKLIFYRRAGLKDSIVSAVFHMVENEFFKPGYNDNWGAKYDRLTYKFTLTDKLTKPSIWDTYWQSRFGDYSARKILFLTQLLNFTSWNVGGLFPQVSNQMIQEARFGLYNYEQEHGPMLDENGNRVIIP
ncbi:DUF4843 domain-containing protein [Sphingobacterium psychroaquaticum]|uniref:DUF4843 domain-containing protein n=1 Tax=Sphingobacterium psychroaquaticum TaxID=561061 RepID=A0A1X7HW37_9SPHI|nr:DUF4843 domain-containing protein [Sphingobacterium psychroaquaticum]SMG06212.1 protein of unknown function [Sphingobacterium psychroaquaticum]